MITEGSAQRPPARGSRNADARGGKRGYLLVLGRRVMRAWSTTDPTSPVPRHDQWPPGRSGTPCRNPALSAESDPLRRRASGKSGTARSGGAATGCASWATLVFCPCRARRQRGPAARRVGAGAHGMLRGAEAPVVAPLSRHELDVLRHLAAGFRIADIADRMPLSSKMGEFHLSEACGRLSAERRGRVAAVAAERGWLNTS